MEDDAEQNLQKGGGGRKLHNEELCDLCFSSNVVKLAKSRTQREVINLVRMFGGKYKGTRPLARPNRRCKYDFKMNLTQIRQEGMEWIYFAQYVDHWQALVNNTQYMQLQSNTTIYYVFN